MTKTTEQANLQLINKDNQRMQEQIEKQIITMIIGDNRDNKQYIIPRINEKMFTNQIYRKFFKVIEQLFNKKQDINVFSVCDKLDLYEYRYLLAQLYGEFITNVNYDYYVKKLVDNYIQRSAENAKTYEDIKAVEQERAKYAKTSPISKLSDGAEKLMNNYYISMDNAIFTGYRDVDNIIGSFQDGDFILIAGAPGMGKTCFELNLINNIAKNNKKILFFSLEMSKAQLQNRIICSHTGLQTDKLRKFTLSSDEVNKFQEYAENDFKLNDNVYICDDFDITITDVVNIIKQSNADIVFIDYLGLINSNNQNGSYEKYSEISRQLKITALTCKKKIIALHQLNRSSADRKDKRPKLTDIRDSGKIEQDIDMALFVYRPAYYDTKAPIDLLECIVAKNRHGASNKIAKLCYNPNTQKITNRVKTERNSNDE